MLLGSVENSKQIAIDIIIVYQAHKEVGVLYLYNQNIKKIYMLPVAIGMNEMERFENH